MKNKDDRRTRLSRFIGRFLVCLVVIGFAMPFGVRSDPFPMVDGEWIPDGLVFAETSSDQSSTMTRVVLVDKSIQMTFLYEFREQWHIVDSWPCSTGKAVGRKQVEGDQKTPEGIYFITRHVEGRFLSDTYGTRALPLDYPNWLDRRGRRGGSAIWLHGTNKPLKPRDSNGCIVLENDHIDRLAQLIELQRTPVIVVEKRTFWNQDQAQSEALNLLVFLDQWKEALMGEDYLGLNQFYAKDAAPSPQWWTRWNTIRHHYGIDPLRCVSTFENISIFKHDGIYTILFDHYLLSGEDRIQVGYRKLYLTIQEDHMQIIGHFYLKNEGHQRSSARNDPLFEAWETLQRQAFSQKMVIRENAQDSCGNNVVKQNDS